MRLTYRIRLLQEELTEEVGKLLGKLAGSELSTELLLPLMKALHLLSEFVQQPIELLTTLAMALPNAFSNGPLQSTTLLLECYSLFVELCVAFPCLQLKRVTDTGTGATAGGLLALWAVMAVLNPSVLKTLQQHLLCEFLEPDSRRLSTAGGINMQDLSKLLEVLQQYQVPLSTSFLTRCTTLSVQYIQGSGGSCRLVKPYSGTCTLVCPLPLTFCCVQQPIALGLLLFNGTGTYLSPDLKV